MAFSLSSFEIGKPLAVLLLLCFLQTFSVVLIPISETITNIPLPIYHQQLNSMDGGDFISGEKRARRAGGDECEWNEVESTVRKREEG